MAGRYRMSTGRRAVNAVVSLVTRLGVGPRGTYLLTTVGRKSGKRRTTPVSIVTRDGGRWLVAPYGARPWVLNVRASGRAELRRGRKREVISLSEVDAQTAAPVLRDYLQQNSITRRFFDVTAESPAEEFTAEAHRHPVFRMETEPR